MTPLAVGRHTSSCVPVAKGGLTYASTLDHGPNRVIAPHPVGLWLAPLCAGILRTALAPRHSLFIPHALPAVVTEAPSATTTPPNPEAESARVLALTHFRSLLESQDTQDAPNRLLGWSLDKAALRQVARQIWPSVAVADDVRLGKLLLVLVLLTGPGAALTAGRAGIRTLAMVRMLGLRDFRMAELVAGDDMFVYSGSFDDANGADQLGVNLSCSRLQLALSLRPDVLSVPPRPQLQADSETLERANLLQAKLQAHKQAIQQKRGEQYRISLEESQAQGPLAGIEHEPELERMRAELAAIMKAMLMSAWHVGTSAEKESPVGWVLDVDKARQEADKTWALAAPECALLKLGVLLVLLHAPGACMEVDAMAMAVSKLLDRSSWAPHKPMDVLEDDIGIFTTQMVPVGGSNSTMIVALDIPAYLTHRTQFIDKASDTKSDAAAASNSTMVPGVPPAPPAPVPAASSPAGSAVSSRSSSSGTGVASGRMQELDTHGVAVLSSTAAEFAAGLRSKGVKLSVCSEMQQQALMQAQVLGCLRSLLQEPSQEGVNPDCPLGWRVDRTVGDAFAELVWPQCDPALRRIKLGLLLVLLNEPGCTSTTKYAGPTSCEVMNLDSWSPYRLRDIVGQDPIFLASPCEEEGHWSIHANLPTFLTFTFKDGTRIPGLDNCPGKMNAATALFDAARVATEKAAVLAARGPPPTRSTIKAASAAAAAVNARQQAAQQQVVQSAAATKVAGTGAGGAEAELAAAGAEVAVSTNRGVPGPAEELVRASATWGSTRTELSSSPHQPGPSAIRMASSLADSPTSHSVASPWVYNSPQANERYRSSIIPKLTSMLKDHTSNSGNGGNSWSFRMGVARVIAGWLWPECSLDVSLVKLALTVALMSEPSATAPLQRITPRVRQLLADKKCGVEDLRQAVDGDPVFLMAPSHTNGTAFSARINIAAFQEKVAAANAISEYQHHEEQQHNQKLQQLVTLQARQRQHALTNTPELASHASSLRQKMLMAAMSRAGANLAGSNGTVQELSTSVNSGSGGGGEGRRRGTPGVSQAASLLAQALIRASVNVAKRLLPGQVDVGEQGREQDEDGRKWVVGRPVMGPAPAVRPPPKAMAFQETRAESMLARVVSSIDADLNTSANKGELGWTARCMVTNLPGGLAPVVGFAVARERREAKQKAALRALTDLKGCGVDVYNILRQAAMPGPQLLAEDEVVDVTRPVVQDIQMGGRTVAIGLTDARFPDKYLPLQQHMVLAATIVSSYGVAVDMGLLRRALIVPRCNVKSSRRLAWIGATQFGSAIKQWLDGASPAEEDDTSALQEVFDSYTSSSQCSTYLRDLGLERFVVTPAGETASEEELQSVFYAVIGAIYWSSRAEEEVYCFLCNSGIIRV